VEDFDLPQIRLSMRKLKEVLRLHSLGLKQQQIARSCLIAQSTVHLYLKAAAAAGVKWPLPPDWDDRRLEEAVSGAPRAMQIWRKSEKPDFGAIRHELQRHRNLTLQLVWEEYRQDHPDGYSYSRFCELYRDWGKNLDVVLRHEYRAGEKLFIDYAGDKIPIYDRQTGEVDFQASLFVAVLGASSYTFVEATRSQDLSCWIDSHVHALEFLGGAPEVAIPDNTKTGVKHPCRYEPELNPTYRELAEHYGFAVVPARPYKPRDKACVSYCTLCGACNVESWLRSTAASLSLANRTLVQRFIKTAPGIVVAVLFEPSFSCPKIDCSGCHIVPDAHLFGSKQPLGSQTAIAAHQVESLSDMRNLLQVERFTLPGLPSSSI
jgi:transposase